jgi:hypothetical protein
MKKNCKKQQYEFYTQVKYDSQFCKQYNLIFQTDAVEVLTSEKAILFLFSFAFP